MQITLLACLACAVLFSFGFFEGPNGTPRFISIGIVSIVAIATAFWSTKTGTSTNGT